MPSTLVICFSPTLEWCETVVKFVGASVCVPLSDCAWSYLSVWLHNKAAFTLLRSFYSANHIQSARHTVWVHAQSQAQPTATYSLPSLARTPSLYLFFSLANCFVIYVAFLKPLSFGHDGPLSVHKIIELQTHRCLLIEKVRNILQNICIFKQPTQCKM